MESQEKLFDYLKKASAELQETRKRLHKMEAAEQEPIAIVGMGCRLPGGVNNPEQFWDLLAAGADAVSGFPQDRGWDVAGESAYARKGGFVSGAAEFDAGFFGISPREALAMDPQQRLLLEVSWEALERAGIDPTSLRGSRTGVFAGASSSGYGADLAGEDSGAEGYLLTGNAGSVISGRVSYSLGLEGPAVTVDTACSSSLVALHQACQAVRSGECSLALAGGVMVMSTPGVFAEFSRQQGLAADGRCKAFSASADGTGWAEGAGMLVVERLSDAHRAGHEVLAVIRGSAVNQDGASNGLTAPNGPAQQRVIQAALVNARLSTADVDVVEGHGTGTTLGDPIEAQAVLATYGQGRDCPVWLGSVKSNIGHAQQAAGVTGVMKMVLALRHGVLPATLHVDEPSPHVDWSTGQVRLLTEAVPWDGDGSPRRAGISAFGMSGTNAHVIVEEAPAADNDAVPSHEAVLAGTGVSAWTISGRDTEGLSGQAGRLREFALSRPELAPVDVGWSLATTRSSFEHRAVALGTNRETLAAGLAAVATGQPASGVITGVTPAKGTGRVTFVFPGQGSQWVGMGRELLECSPVFAARMDECAQVLAPYLDVYEALSGELVAADVVQPVLWAIMVSLAAVWEAAGVAPDAVVGHSQGEIAAACVAGILSLEDGARVVALRSKALRALAGRGGMLSIAESAVKVRERLVEWGERISVAAVNGPAATVVSGEPAALEEFAASCVDVRTRLLPVDYASHNAQVDVLKAEILEVLDGITPREARIPLVSAMSGNMIDGPEMDAEYWYSSLRQPVEFERAIKTLAESGHRVFMECSPHPVLTTAIGDTVERAVTVGTLRRDDGGAARLLSSLAEAHVQGIDIDWAAVLEQGQRVDLPTYAFQHQRYWLQATPTARMDNDNESEFWAAVEGGDIGRLAETLDIDGGRLGELLPALASWRRRERDDSVVTGWRYRVEWTSVIEPGPALLTGTWLVLHPADHPETDVVQALRERGAEVLVVATEPGEINRAALIGRIGDVPRLAGVVSLLALDETPVRDHTMVPAGLAATVGVVQALGDLAIDAPLWVVTRGAVAASSDETVLSPVQAQVWGLGRVIGLEHPRRWGGLIDLPPVWDERAANRLTAVLSGCGEDQIALRAKGILGRRLGRATQSPANKTWTPRGTVLITGGTGAIGGRVARWLAGRGATRMVLTSRSGAGAAGVAALASELAALGSAVDVIGCDVGERRAVAGVLDRVGPLCGVVHAAGVGTGAAVQDTTTDELADVLGAKVGGARWLDELTADMDLDAFVVFSSAAAVWGSGSLGGYGAGNAFVEALVQRRRAHGLAGSSVAWGLWGGSGGMVSDQAGDVLRRLGMGVMDPDKAMAALAQVVDSGEGPVTVADVVWDQFAPMFTLHRGSPLIESMSEARQSLAADSAETGMGHETELAQRLDGLSRTEQVRVLLGVVRAEAAAALGFPAAEQIESDRAFRDVGFDSLTAVELRNRLNAVTGLALPSTLVFDYPTAAELAGYLRDELLGTQAEVVAPAVVGSLDDPIAVVGMGCRYPGGVRDPEGLWGVLVGGVDAVGGFPVDRGWDVLEERFGADASSYARRGGFVYDAAGFDAGFFGVSPREALAMDPQQRVLLEVAWETVERAGLDPRGLRGSSTGVFVGATHSGYGVGLGVEGGSEGYLLTGGLTAVISGRVSYSLGLTGPAVTVDTACSSSLVALHQACGSLRVGECSLALAGGVAVLSTPGAFMEFSRQQGLASDGRCKAFAAEADGMGWGEGAGLVLLERLSDAERNGHEVLAVVRGSAVNSDGASNGLAAPNGPSQQRVIRAALSSAGLSVGDVDVVEAHGTGTMLGDPIEAQAVLATYGQGRERPLWLGSVKSNIGHAQTAAGVAGVIKMVLALGHEELPQTLHAGNRSPHIDWSAGKVSLLTESVSWPVVDTPRRAGVSAFGVSGTNVHMIIEEAPKPKSVHKIPAQQDSVPVLQGSSAWVVSGHNHEGLIGQASRLREFLLANKELNTDDVGWSLINTRTEFDHRAVVLASGREELVAGLAAVATDQPATGVISGTFSDTGRVVLVFPGQGSQWMGMGQELLSCSPAFAARMAECAAALAPYVDWDLPEMLGTELVTADAVQPVLWAIMVSLAAVWEAAGVTPDAVVGHSQGEIAAACVAGILSLEDGARVVALRSKALRALAGQGGMLSIAEPAANVRARLTHWDERISVAAVNGPSATVVSGEPQALDELAKMCAAEDVRTRLLPVDYASHNAQIDALREEILLSLEGITPCEARIPLMSAMSGELLAGPEMGAEYWYSSLRQPVEFDRAIRILAESGHRTFIEASPHPVLTGAIGDTVEDAVITGTLRRDDGGATRLLSSLAEAYVHGVTVDWTTLLEGRRVELPTYAFQHQHFWPQAATGHDQPEDEEEQRFWAAVENGDLEEVAGTLDVDGQRPLRDLLPALASWRRRERADTTLAGWRYRISWAPVNDSAQAVLSGTWLMVVPAAQQQLALRCRESLTERGAQVLVAEVAAGEVDRAALAERIAAVDVPLAGVLSLLGLDETRLDGFPAVTNGIAATLGLVQALGDTDTSAPLWAITQGAVSTGTGDNPANPVQAQVWGLGRVVGLEHAQRWGGLIDLPTEWDGPLGARLVAILAGCGEDQVALRQPGILARRLVRAAARRTQVDDWTPHGSALVTGATGEIGPYLLRWLAGRNTQRVILPSRSGPTTQVAALVAELANAGTGVELLACDTTRRTEIAGLLDRIAASDLPLSSVFHAANAGRQLPLESVDVDGLGLALGAKAAGAVWLDELTADVELDAFVLFSSIAATWGSNEHAAYAAGNAALDALAENRRTRGLRATSIAWGVWDTRDWAAVDALVEHKPGSVTPARLLRQGMKFLDPGRALTALGQVLSDDETFIAVADVDWERFAPVFTAARPRPLIDTIPEVRELRSMASETTPVPGELRGLSGADRERALTDLVRTNAAAVLGHSSITEVPAGRAFRDMGFDSLTAVELRGKLNTATGARLPSTVIFDYPTPTALARHLGGQLFGTAETRQPVSTTAAATDEPIAIVGMGCRFPGGVTSPAELWDVLVREADVISGFPADRGWDVEGLFDPDPDHAGTSYVCAGGFLQGVADFDAGFFGINPREALAMDPQQRLLLETSWEALERAGISAESLRGTATGVFAGAAPSGYGAGLHNGDSGAEGYLITGNSPSVLSGRVSYTFGLEGPAVTVDTACSSSLVALHLACQALRAGECSMALAGGVMVMTDPTEFVGFSRQRVLAVDGRCKAFAADADGMGMGEGAGMVLVERLSDAQRNGHEVLAVIRGSAINQDGASNGLTAPNGPSQQRVIAAALANARLSADEVDVVEAHGTGTALGDPIEAQALLATYGQDRAQPLWLGSVKSNIGHAQQAAGVAGVMKMVLALQHGRLPATLHVDEPSPHVDWSTGAVRLLTEPVDWSANERPRRAGVSAFGISGTNAHLIIEEAPARESVHELPEPVLAGVALPWVVSARSARGVAGQAARLRDFVTEHPEVSALDVGWSLATTRGAHDYRAVALGSDRDELLAGLSALEGGSTHGDRVGFVFAGQGSQRSGMAAGLHAASPVFAAVFDELCARLETELNLPIADVVLGRVEPDDERAHQTVFAQTGLFALQVGMCAVLEACGVRPDAVAGHSVGEIAAAHIAGVLDREDACRLVAARASLMQALPQGGAMAAIAATEAEMLDALGDADRVGIAAVNGPESVVISGEEADVEAIADSWKAKGRRVKPLRVSHAFHSARMDPMLAELEQIAASIDARAPRIALAGALTGELLAECTPEYWSAQARRPVRFADAVATLAAQDISTFIEIGPDGTLSAMGSTVLDSAAEFIPLLRKDIPAEQSVVSALSKAYVRGAAVEWTALLPGGQRVELPTYAFQHQRFWPEPAAPAVRSEDGAESGFWAAIEDGSVHELLSIDDGRPFREVVPELAAWRNRERQGSTVADWRYRVSWTPLTDPGAATLDGTWLLVEPTGHTDTSVQRALTDRGATVTTLRMDPDMDRATVATLISDSAADVCGVLSLLAVDETPTAEFPTVCAGIAGSLLLAQALGDADIDAPLWMLTSGAVATGPAELLEHPLQAQVWGLGRVIGLEHPQRWGGLIDLPAVLDERAAGRMCAVLAGCGEDQVAVRPSGVLARRLTRAPQPKNPRTWTPRGSVLITGGTGGIGGHVGRWLSGRGAEHLVLTSRSGSAVPGIATQLAELAGAGTAVDVIGCDISRRAEVAGLVNRIGPELRAVIHSAGIGEATAVADFTMADLARVSAVKVAGARWLDELTSDIELDAFVVFSSISATWGSGAQPGYAAANAFLDALTAQRRARGLVSSSVAWGVWDGAGMGGGDASMQLRRFGLRPMDPALGIQALAQVIDAREGEVAVADVDWERFAPTFTLRRPSPLLDTIPEARVSEEPTSVGEVTALTGRLAGLSRAEQDRLLTDLVRTEAAAALGYPSAEAVESGRAFKELGFDSLTAVELRNRLTGVTGFSLPATLVFDYPTPTALAGYLWKTEFQDAEETVPLLAELDKLDVLLSGADPDEETHARLQEFLAKWSGIGVQSQGQAVAEHIESATDDEVLEFIHKELGRS